MCIGRKFKKGRRPPKLGATEAGGGVVVEVGVGVAVDDVSVEVGVGVAVDSASPSPLRRSPRHQPSPLRRSPRRPPSTKVTSQVGSRHLAYIIHTLDTIRRYLDCTDF